jgi:hydroxylysine kinase
MSGENALEEELSRQRHIVDDAEALGIVRRFYGLSGTLTRFETEKDGTFRLNAADGRQYVLKIANPSEKRSEIEFQIALMRHVKNRDASLPIPAVFDDREGNCLPEIITQGHENRLVRLMSFIPGTPLDQVSSSRTQRESIGEILACLRLAMSDFSHPADSRTVAWDVSNLLTLSHLLPDIEDRQHRLWIEVALAHFENIKPELDACRRQVLHNDFNTSNIVVSRSDHDVVSGIIDFGDAVRTAVAVDVSTALMNQMPKQFSWAGRTDLFDEARDVLTGYFRHADLTDGELRLVPFLALGRLATRALLTSWRAKLFPENSRYILRHTHSGWAHLEWFASLSSQKITALFQ